MLFYDKMFGALIVSYMQGQFRKAIYEHAQAFVAAERIAHESGMGHAWPNWDVKVLDEIDFQIRNPETPASALQCPKCRLHMKLITVDSVEIDTCLICRSSWFDRGELDQLSEGVVDAELVEGPSGQGFLCQRCDSPMIDRRLKPLGNFPMSMCGECGGMFIGGDDVESLFHSVLKAVADKREHERYGWMRNRQWEAFPDEQAG